MKKKIIILLAVITAFCALTSCSSLPVLPIGGPTSGSTGDCTWTLDGKVLTISGNGDMGMNTWFTTPPWGDDITKVIIEDGVTAIGGFSFYECSSLKSISIPDSVTDIGQSAFWGCSSLKDIDINCVEYIAESAFVSCSSLQSINIPACVDFIGEGVFSGCTSLESITVLSGNEKYYAKGNCLIEKSTDRLIAGCKTSVIPDSVIRIGSRSFAFCESLTSVTIPNSVTNIGENAFNGCTGLTDITIPIGVSYISDGAFFQCENLKTVYIHSPDAAKEIRKMTFNTTTDPEYYVETICVKSSIADVSDFIAGMPYKTENVMIDGVKYTVYSNTPD
ncbi:MAG: leucine-rich repeat domain-containing protein [Clostridia bacterium]|nr:leucine-rich repeat domain-containing protein [Clostridia bacterium]